MIEFKSQSIDMCDSMIKSISEFKETLNTMDESALMKSLDFYDDFHRLASIYYARFMLDCRENKHAMKELNITKSWYKRQKFSIYKYPSKWYSLIIRYGKSH